VASSEEKFYSTVLIIACIEVRGLNQFLIVFFFWCPFEIKINCKTNFQIWIAACGHEHAYYN
jgi:hypothetical protein